MKTQENDTLTDEMRDLFNEAFYLIANQSLEKNEDDYLHKLETDPEYLATIDFGAKNRRDYQEALLLFNRILQSAPQHVYTLEMRGITYFRCLDTDKAIKDFDKVIEISPERKNSLSL